MFCQIFLCFGSPRSLACQHLIVNDSKCPDITFKAVFVLVKSFRRHVYRAANIIWRIFLALSLLHGKPKICNFNLAVPEEDVGRFEVAMDDSSLVNVVVAIEYLIHQSDGFCLWDTLPIGYKFSQISSLAELGDDVSVVFCVIDVKNFYDVLTILQTFQHFYLRSE